MICLPGIINGDGYVPADKSCHHLGQLVFRFTTAGKLSGPKVTSIGVCVADFIL